MDCRKGKSRSVPFFDGNEGILHTKLNLSLVSRAALIGLTYIYAVKIIDTFWHGLFTQPALALSVAGLNILAGIAQLVFYVKLPSAIILTNRPLLLLAGWLGITGSAISILPKLLALALLYQKALFFPLLRNGHLVALFSPWLGAVLLFSCCMIFFLNSSSLQTTCSRRALAAGAAGYFTMAVVLSFIVVNYFSGVRHEWSNGQIGIHPVIFLATVTFTYLGAAYFFGSFIHFRK